MKSEFTERAKKIDGYQCLDEYLKQWLSDGKAVNRWSLNTLLGYEVNIRKHILPVCGYYRLNEINPEIRDQILRRMKFQGLSDSSMRYVRRTLCAALNDACSYGFILNNPVDHTITRFKQSDFSPVLYDLKDLANLMINAQNGNWECLFLLTGLYGLRRSEALGLKWSHVDFLKREIRIDQQLSTKLVRKQTGEFSSRLKTRDSKRTLYLTSYAMGFSLRQMQRLKEAKEKSTNQCPCSFPERWFTL